MKTIFTLFIALLLHLNFTIGQELLINGDFETGTLASWVLTDAGSGTFQLIAPGAPVPFNSLIASESNIGGGSFHAVSGQIGPGTHALTQSFTVPIGAKNVTLTYDYFVNNRAFDGEFINPIGLDHTGPDNQHSRIDILTAGAAPFSTNPADIVMNIVLGGTNVSPYATGNTADLTAVLIPGTTYQFRFAETDNEGFYHLGVDNVSIFASDVAVASNIPTVSEWGLIVFALMMLNLGLVFRYRQTLVLADAPNVSFSAVPFDKALFTRYFGLTLLVLLVLFGIAMFGFGYQLMAFDMPGSLLTAALLGYMGQLVSEAKS